MVTACCTTLPSTMVPMTSRRLAFFWNAYSPGLRSERAFSANTLPMNTQRLMSITPSRCSMSAMSRHAGARGMLTILSSRQRTRRLDHLLAVDIDGRRRRSSASSSDGDDRHCRPRRTDCGRGRTASAAAAPARAPARRAGCAAKWAASHSSMQPESCRFNRGLANRSPTRPISRIRATLIQDVIARIRRNGGARYYHVTRSIGHAPHDHGSVGAAEPERIRQRDIDLALARRRAAPDRSPSPPTDCRD